MGMFDDIIVPKSYLKGLLTKDQEKLIKNNDYQTKSLENFLSRYKIYRQKLYIKQGELKNDKEAKWTKDNYTGEINFYTSFSDQDDNSWWVEFNFYFIDGSLDKKELVKFEIEETAEEAETRAKEWEKITNQRKLFEKTLRYRFYNKISTFLFKLSQWAYQKTLPPVVKKTKTKEEKLSLWKHS